MVLKKLKIKKNQNKQDRWTGRDHYRQVDNDGTEYLIIVSSVHVS